MIGDVRFELALNAKMQRFVASRWTRKDGVETARIMDDALITGQQFPRAYETQRASWKPLTEKYVRWKIARGYSPEPWVMTGRTVRSLDRPIRSWTAGGGRALSRLVSIIQNAAGAVSLEWRIMPPAAGGRFGVVNAARQLVIPAFGDILRRGRASIGDYIKTRFFGERR